MKTPEKPPQSEPIVDSFEAAIFAAELGSEAPELDLHGLTVDEAVSEADRFINHEAVAGAEVVKLIHGRGEGKLRTVLHTWLKGQRGLVARFRDSNKPGEQGGVTYVALERLR